jgi:F-type H+-transporting ATPase subunit delta
MLAQQVAKKYSSALFQLAVEKNIIDKAWDQFKTLADYLKRDRTFLDFMTAPQISDQKKEALVKAAFEKQLDVVLFDFVMFLVEKRRVRFLPEIIEAFDLLVREQKGIAKATCITAEKITDDERRKLIEKLAQKTSLQIELQERIDKSILGGMVIILRDQIIDGSIRYGLNQLKNRLMKVKVH